MLLGRKTTKLYFVLNMAYSVDTLLSNRSVNQSIDQLSVIQAAQRAQRIKAQEEERERRRKEMLKKDEDMRRQREKDREERMRHRDGPPRRVWAVYHLDISHCNNKNPSKNTPQNSQTYLFLRHIMSEFGSVWQTINLFCVYLCLFQQL